VLKGRSYQSRVPTPAGEKPSERSIYIIAICYKLTLCENRKLMQASLFSARDIRFIVGGKKFCRRKVLLPADQGTRGVTKKEESVTVCALRTRFTSLG